MWGPHMLTFCLRSQPYTKIFSKHRRPVCNNRPFLDVQISCYLITFCLHSFAFHRKPIALAVNLHLQPSEKSTIFIIEMSFHIVFKNFLKRLSFTNLSLACQNIQ